MFPGETLSTSDESEVLSLIFKIIPLLQLPAGSVQLQTSLLEAQLTELMVSAH